MIRSLLAAFAFSLLLSHAAAAGLTCDPGVVEIRAGDTTNTFTIELASSPQEQARGLMFRPSLAQDAGMLFVFETPRKTSFWMRNTMIPLDMIFIDETGRIESIVERNDPYSERPASSQGVVRAVLEINGGQSRALAISPGAQVIHPTFQAAPPEFACSN